MYKKSIIIVLIEVSAALLGLINIYYVAGDMEPALYSLVGVYTLVSGIMLTFTHLGLETTMGREALYWKEQEREDYINEYASQSLFSRFMSGIILSPFILGYLLFLNNSKYEGQFTLLMMCIFIGAFFSAVNDSMALIVRSFGEYVFSTIASTINTYFIKFSGLILYYLFGSTVYLYFYVLSSIPLTFIYLIKLRRVFDFKYFHIRDTVKKVWQSRYLCLKCYMDYVATNADSLLVSLLFPASIMGTYTIYKRLESMVKQFISGFFDILLQNMVRFKGNYDRLIQEERKIKKARNAAIIILLAGAVIYSMNMEYFVSLVNLNNYEHIQVLILCVFVVGILYLLGKFEINGVALFAPGKTVFILGIIYFALSMLSYVCLIIQKNIYGMIGQRIIVYLTYSLLMVVAFRRKKKSFYKMTGE